MGIIWCTASVGDSCGLHRGMELWEDAYKIIKLVKSTYKNVSLTLTYLQKKVKEKEGGGYALKRNWNNMFAIGKTSLIQ